MKLYEMCDNLIQIDNILENNTDPETQDILESAKDELLKEIDGKIENILNFINDCESKSEQLSNEVKRLMAKRKSLDNKVEYLKNMVFWVMKTNGQQKAEYGTYNLTISKTPPKVIITEDGQSLLPDYLCKITRVPDKALIKEKIGSNKELTVEIDGRNIILAKIDDNGECLRIR